MLKRYLIERTIPNVGHWPKEEYKKAVEHSNEVLQNLGSDIKWEESFVTDDKIYCIYQAANEEIIRKHASMGGFPADMVFEIRGTLNPEYGQEEYKRPYTTGNSGVDLNLS